MPSVEDMHRLGCTLLDALAVDLGPVAGDDRHAGMVLQPFGRGVGIAIGQEIHNGPALQIDDDRAVASPAPPRPLVDGDHAWRRRDRYRPGPDHAQEGGRAGRQREPVGQPRCRRSAERETEMALHLLEPLRAPGMRDGHVRQALAEGAAGAGRIAAAQAAQAHAQTE